MADAMQTCKTCRYWKEPFGGRPAWRVCHKIIEGIRSIDHPLPVLSQREEDAMTANGGPVVTRAEFGCTLHAPIEDDD